MKQPPTTGRPDYSHVCQGYVPTRDIEDHMRDIYGIDVSPTMVSKVTDDKILPIISKWQSRQAAYSVLGINMAGQKNILGIWIGENESASFNVHQ